MMREMAMSCWSRFCAEKTASMRQQCTCDQRGRRLCGTRCCLFLHLRLRWRLRGCLDPPCAPCARGARCSCGARCCGGTSCACGTCCAARAWSSLAGSCCPRFGVARCWRVRCAGPGAAGAGAGALLMLFMGTRSLSPCWGGSILSLSLGMTNRLRMGALRCWGVAAGALRGHCWASLYGGGAP